MFELNNPNEDMLTFLISHDANVDNTGEFPVIKSFKTIEEEMFSLNNGVGLRYLVSSGIIELKGKDSIDFLNRISTNSVNNLKKAEVMQTIFTSEKGRIIGVSTILNFESYLLLVSSLKNQPKITSWINKYIISDDVAVSNANHRFNVFEILGPQAESFLTFTCGETVGEIAENSFKVVNCENALFFLIKIKNENEKPKFWVMADQENSKKLLTAMITNKGPYDFNLIGDDAYNAYRIEMGIPSDPDELNDFYNPLEAKINHLIDFKKGCYIGQEVIARLDTYKKVQKFLMGICFPENINGDEKFSILDDQKKEIGTITSIAFSPRKRKNIALGYIQKDNAVNGNKAFAKNESKEVEVTLHELPFKK